MERRSIPVVSAFTQDELDHLMRCAGLAEVMLEQMDAILSLADRGDLKQDSIEWRAVRLVRDYAKGLIHP